MRANAIGACDTFSPKENSRGNVKSAPYVVLLWLPHRWSSGKYERFLNSIDLLSSLFFSSFCEITGWLVVCLMIHPTTTIAPGQSLNSPLHLGNGFSRVASFQHSTYRTVFAYRRCQCRSQNRRFTHLHVDGKKMRPGYGGPWSPGNLIWRMALSQRTCVSDFVYEHWTKMWNSWREVSSNCFYQRPFQQQEHQICLRLSRALG